MPAIKSHSTAVDGGAWDGGKATKNAKADQDAAYYGKIFAWKDPDGDPKLKGTYKFPHHFVSADGDPGAASIKACQSIIAILNGGMGGADIPSGDRQGVWNHAAKHLKDGDVEPAELKALDLEREIRTVDIEMRAADGDAGPIIEGTAAVYNRWSEDLGGFREMIEPGFFENVLKQDVRALFNHDESLVLGRTRNGTLKLEDNERGLDVNIKPPDTQNGRDVIILVKRGDVTQMSFAFRVKHPDGDEWIQEKDGKLKRILKRGGAEKLYDVSPVTYPAYPQTSVHARSEVARLSEERQEPDLGSEGEATEKQERIRRAHRQREMELLEIKNKI